jgi:hypothetical protein
MPCRRANINNLHTDKLLQCTTPCMQGISRALRHPIRPTLPPMDLRWASCLRQRGRWRPRITLVSKVCMHKQQLELAVNELQQWTSNRWGSRRPYKESLVILIPMLPSDCSLALHITRRHLMAMLIQHQVLGEEEVETSETMILSVTLRPEQWVTASCTRINGTDVYMRSSQTASVCHRTLVFSSRFAIPRQIYKSRTSHCRFNALSSRSFAPSMQSSAHYPVDFRRSGWVSPATAIPRAYLGTSPADGFTSVKAQVAFLLAQNSDCPETKMNTASNQSPSGHLKSKLRKRIERGLHLYFG